MQWKQSLKLSVGQSRQNWGDLILQIRRQNGFWNTWKQWVWNPLFSVLFFYLCSVVYLAFEIILKIDWRFFRVCFVDIIRLWAASYFETGCLRKMLFITVRKVHQDFVSDSNSLPIIVHSRILCNFSRVRYVSSQIKYEIFRVGNICWYLQENMELRAFQKYTENLKYFMQVLNLVL